MTLRGRECSQNPNMWVHGKSENAVKSRVLVRCEQRHLYANKAKTEMCYFCLKHYKTRYTPEKRDRFLKNPSSERDQNEIGTRYKFA